VLGLGGGRKIDGGAKITASTIVLYLAVRKRLDRSKGSFDLGNFELPATIGALAWLVGAVFVLIVIGLAGSGWARDRTRTRAS
jgi:hypothetical protein